MNTFSAQRSRPAESHPLRAGTCVSEKLPAAEMSHPVRAGKHVSEKLPNDTDVAPEPKLEEAACNGCVSP